ncbi:MAG: hypoxanthine-guanine phosphoribosyltransferase [Betaproteobacteria bacterium]|nr:MAG: hypoxanthine-guanine phosphoribosyltransferase [Betaproteobacteria bacterium]TMG75512.1 MAG: hypoxanthine-guanine phosphoribosyltransferase [Betaproteobacteria bacterium]
MAPDEAWKILKSAELLCDEAEVRTAIARLASEITASLKDRYPLVLAVMGGSIFFAGNLLPQLRFPLEFDYIHASRYGKATSGREIVWTVEPGENVRSRCVLVLDDILDGGETLAAIRDRVRSLGAAAFYSAVLTDKDIGRKKPIVPDFIGLKLPNRYVFGCGMDVSGAWRNLPAIYAVKGS